MTCTNNCNQGRACDCVPDIDPPEDRVSGWITLAILATSAALVIGPCAYLWVVLR